MKKSINGNGILPTRKERMVVSFYIIIGLLGGFVGFKVVGYFEILVRGLIGLSTLYLIHLLFFPPKDLFSEFLNNISLKSSMTTFCLGIVFSWAIYFIVTAMRYYL